MPLPEDVLKRFFQLTVVMSDAMEEDLARRGLTRARATLMARLRDEGPTTQSALAQALGVSPRNVTGLVNGLEGLGLAKRSPHPSDRRAVLVNLTDDGSDAAAALANDEREFARYLLADRTTTEMRILKGGFDQLLRRLDEPGYQTMRRAALDRWPLATKTRRTSGSRFTSSRTG